MSSIGSSFEAGSKAIIFGASGAIGSAFVTFLTAEYQFQVFELSRSGGGMPFDVFDEATIEAAAKDLATQGPFDLLINCIGLLHDETGIVPEKNLKQLNGDSLGKYFRINTIGPALVLKHFTPLMPRDRRSVFASLSARVGSLGDNRLGGWYGYRASKAAHNMILKNAAIELARTHPSAVLAAIHPGTVRSALSDPYAKGHAVFSPSDAVRRIFSVVNDLRPEHSGEFFAYDGSIIPW